MTDYVPRLGDIVWLDMHPQKGKEITKRRPFLVLTPAEYNQKIKLLVGCPITSKVKKYPFEITLPENLITNGAVLCDQIKNVDWRGRNAVFIEQASKLTIHKTKLRISTLLGIKISSH
tara:strand:- start:30043 stop:30396 length:354 start_codon:yes stop_codon:yes gene_type:complete